MKQTNGSILLLTVMIMAILTTTTLGALALRFDQLSATDRVNNSSVAKLAADSGLVKLKDALTSGQSINPTGVDLTKNPPTQTSLTDTANFKPNPRSSYATYEKSPASLPRCLAVAVITPWVNTGQYLFQDNAPTNPALIFNYANIVNDTPLGVIPNNNSLSPTEKKMPISQLTNMGHFFNPYAPIGSTQDSPLYWTIKMGGPDDQFLTKLATDGTHSYFQGLDFTYIPYLPRFTDSGLFSTSSGTGLDRLSGDDLRSKFEQTITKNNFRVWLDASMSDEQLFQYGLGDLFVNDPNYRITWLQPTLWNDEPEADLAAAYTTDNIDAAQVNWAKKSQPLYVPSNGENGWQVGIFKGAKSFSFLRLASGSNAIFSPNADIPALLYGSLEGIRLNQEIVLQLVDKARSPLQLQSRVGNDQGKLLNVYFKNIGPTSTSGGVETINVTLHLSGDSFDTPKKSDGNNAKASDLDSIVVLAGPQFSTEKSLSNVTFTNGNGGVDVPISVNSACQPSSGTLTACPAVGDYVSFSKASSSRLWGRVKTTTFSANGSTMTGFTVDKLHNSPKPMRNMASTVFNDPNDGGKTKIAFYGGDVNMNDYDGGYYSEGDELWIYDPAADSWTFKQPQTINSTPSRRAGGSMVFDSLNNRLVLFGGLYHEGIGPNGYDCELNQPQCLHTNTTGRRVAKRVTNDVFAFNLTGGNANKWEKIDYTFDASQKIQNGTSYTMRVLSTLADRSGLEGWYWSPQANQGTGITQTINLNGTAESSIQISPTVAGLAIGDSIFLSGTPQGGGSFIGWGRIKTITASQQRVSVVVHGDKSGQGSINLTQLSLQVIDRQATAQTCTGSVGSKNGLISCNFSSVDQTAGYAIGDSIVLEQYGANGDLDNVLTGYISYLDAGVVYFVGDERLAVLKDFSDPSSASGIIAGESAIAFPWPRYGASWGVRPDDASLTYLWQGAGKNINKNINFQAISQASFSAGSTSVTWLNRAMNNPDPQPNQDYNFQVIKSNYYGTVFTTASGNEYGGNLSPIQKEETTDPRTGQLIRTWNNSQQWILNLMDSDAEALAHTKVVAGASIIIERQDMATGARETFHGHIISNFTNGPAKLKIQHDPGFDGDSGFAVDANNLKIEINSSFWVNSSLGMGRWNSASRTISVSNVADNSRIPPLGAAVLISRSTNGVYEAYTMIVADRTYSGNSFTFTPAGGRLISSPAPISYATNQLTQDAATTRALSTAEYQFADFYQSGAEWAAEIPKPTNNKPSWQIRGSNGDGTIGGERPAPRQGGSTASYYDGNGHSQIYVLGGLYGRYGTLWRMNNAGQMNNISWGVAKSGSQAANDLPNLFGGSLAVYRDGLTNKAVYFGGKLKFDGSTYDYNKFLGPKTLIAPDKDYGFAINDGAYTLANKSSSLDAAGFVDQLSNNYSANVPASIKPSLQLKTGVPLNKTVCAYVGQICNGGNDTAPAIRQLGNIGRMSAGSPYGGYTWWGVPAIINPGSAYRSQNSSPSAILTGSAFSATTSNGRGEQAGYDPYLCDVGGKDCSNTYPYGTNGTNLGSDKTILLAGYTKLTQSNFTGAILFTSPGVGKAVAARSGGTGNGWYSYCADYYLGETGPDAHPDYACKTTTTRYLSWIPDPEDLIFTLNAGLTLAATDTYKVTGFYGGAKRGYLVVGRGGQPLNIEEIVP